MFVHRFIDASYANESSSNNFTERAVNPYIERFRTEYFRGGGGCEKICEASFHCLRNDLFRLSQKLCRENGVLMYTLRQQDLFYSRSLEGFFKECIVGMLKVT